MEYVLGAIKRILILTGIIAGWHVLSLFVIPLFVPSPLSVFNSVIEMIKSGLFPKALLFSFLRITTATALSALVAIPLGLLIFNFKVFKDIFNPVISLMRYIPVTAFYPLLIMWFGINEEMKISFLFLATFVYMLPSVILSLKEVNKDLIDTGLTLGMTKLQTIYKILLPASLPSILQTFIMMYGIGWTYIVVAETVNAKFGLGFIINVSSARGRTDLVFASIIVIMLFSIIFDNIGQFIIKKIFKWRYLECYNLGV